MANEKRFSIPGRSLKRSKGVLLISKHLRVPYTLLKADEFRSLSPVAVKVYLALISQWETHNPDDPVEISVEEIRRQCPGKKRKRDEEQGYIRRNNIQDALAELETKGFIHKKVRHRKCNKYYIEQKWFTGEYM